MRRPGLLLVVMLLATGSVYLVDRFVAGPADDREQLPDFEMETVSGGGQLVTAAAFSRRPALINVWASWCLACRTDHALLMELADSGRIALYGVNYRDDRDDAKRWLDYFGDPYLWSVYDNGGKLGSQLGIEVVPGTYLLATNGRILYRHVGPLSQNVLDKEIWPRVMTMEANTK